jgi:hypothetical protein
MVASLQVTARDKMEAATLTFLLPGAMSGRRNRASTALFNEYRSNALGFSLSAGMRPLRDLSISPDSRDL